MYIQQFFVNGLGCESYLVGCEGAGVAAVIDPDRAIEKYLDAAHAHGMNITHIIETHLHADHVSGNTELAARTGADIYVHADAGAQFPHQALREGDSIALGNVRLNILHTPGHTPESITVLAVDTTRSQEPWMAFTGDTLFVGDIGRPDLVGVEAARGLAQAMHHSLNEKILPLNDALLIYPGHGAGSLCGRSIGAVPLTTLGFEKRHNDALQFRPLHEFVEYAVSNLPEQPGNHTRIKAMNRRGPKPLGEIEPRPLELRDAIAQFQRGAALLDTRSKTAFVERHIPGATHLEADDQLSNRIGFVLPPEAPVVLFLENTDEYANVVYALARVGYENVVGYLNVSLDEWQAMGLPITSGDVQDIDALELKQLLDSGNGSKPVVLDVREHWEYRMGHVPGAVLIPLGQLMSRLNELNPETPVAVICASGSRSQSAAALLGQKGFKKVYNVSRGISEWQMRGLPVEA